MSRFLVFFLLIPCWVEASGLQQFEKELAQLYRDASPSVVSVQTRSLEAGLFFFDVQEKQGAGSGVVIDQKGHILTNWHVVDGARQIHVLFSGEKRYPAKLIGKSPRHDLAVIQVQAPSNLLKPAHLGNSDELQVGQVAVAIGNPFGMLGRTMTYGIISATRRDIDVGGQRFYDMIQTDAAINPGNSGGALLNSRGEVIGISTLIFSQSGGSVGVGFAIPINLAVRFIPDLISKGHVETPRLGIQSIPLFTALARSLRLPVQKGLLVVRVVPATPAARAGLIGGRQEVIVQGWAIPVGGDVITHLDETPVTSHADLQDFLDLRKRKGDSVWVTFWRQGKRHKVKVILGS